MGSSSAPRSLICLTSMSSSEAERTPSAPLTTSCKSPRPDKPSASLASWDLTCPWALGGSWGMSSLASFFRVRHGQLKGWLGGCKEDVKMTNIHFHYQT